MNRLLKIVSLASAMLLVAGCSAGSQETSKAGGTAPPVVLRIGTDDQPGRPGADQIEDVAARVAEATSGTLTIEPVWQAAGVGADDWDQVVARMVVSGELDLGLIPARAWDTEGVTSLQAIHAPLLITSNELLGQVVSSELADDLLAVAALENYEVSNWAKPGHECRHNLLYWGQHDYLGFGCAAHSHMSGRRWWNLRTPERYIAAVTDGTTTEAAGETLDAETRRLEGLQLSLRTKDGVPTDALDGDALDGLVEQHGDRWVLTRHGRLMANEVSVRLR